MLDFDSNFLCGAILRIQALTCCLPKTRATLFLSTQYSVEFYDFVALASLWIFFHAHCSD